MIRMGTGIIYIPRIQSAIDRFGDRFLQRVYTRSERQDCWHEKAVRRNPTSQHHSHFSIEQLAGRWAAKEAVAKALGTGWVGISYTDVEIRRQSSGAPEVILHSRATGIVAAWGEIQWHLSLSHDRDYAIATAISVKTHSQR